MFYILGHQGPVNALVLINTLVLVLVTPAAPAPLAAENTPLALAPADMSGKTAPANSN